MELLAPAGSINALKAAVKGGADAVYLGLGEHNARLKCSDFTEQNVKEYIDFAHLFGIKVYITLNTMITDCEFARALALAESAVRSGADALIVSDLGLFSALSERTNIPLHLSTQAGVQNEYDARFARTLGAKRVILARETVESDIPAIKREVSEVERFAQGALCVCFSGGCLLGSIEYGQSGNRGVCNQPCRLPYTATDENGATLRRGYLLSPFDLSLGEKAAKQADLGVDSLKIEGRLKRAVYVYFATKYYRDLLEGRKESAADSLIRLKRSFNRGFFPGYTLKKSDPAIHARVGSHIGVPVGTVVKTSERSGFKYAYVRSEYDFRKGDGAKILRKGEEVGGSDVTSVSKEGDLQVIPVSSSVKTGDEVRLTTCAEDIAFAESIENKLPLRLTFRGQSGEKLSLIAESCGVRVELKSISALEKGNAPSNRALIEKTCKIGATCFYAESVSDELRDSVFLKISELNALRRSLLETLKEKIILAHTPCFMFNNIHLQCAKMPKRSGNVFSVDDPEDVAELYSYADAFVLDPAVVSVESLMSFKAQAKGKACYLKLPRVARSSDVLFYRNILSEVCDLGVYTDNLYGVSLARELRLPFIAGFGLNISNAGTAALFEDADWVCSSVEGGNAGNLAFVCGKIPLMSFAHCPISVVKGTDCATCDKKTDRLFYRTGEKRYSIRRTLGATCSFTMRGSIVRRNRTPGAGAFFGLIDLDRIEKNQLKRAIEEETWISR